MKPTTIKIDQPCEENWDDMIPNQLGAHCRECAKTVVDFTHLSDHQIISFLEGQRGEVCGRFTTDQLSTPFYNFPDPKRFSLDLKAVLLGASLLTFYPALSSSMEVVPYHQQIVHSKGKQFNVKAETPRAGSILFYIYVEETEEPLLGAKVILRDAFGEMVAGALSDLDGLVSFDLTQEQVDCVESIFISSISFNDMEFKWSDFPTGDFYEIGMSSGPQIIVGMVVHEVSPRKKRRKEKKANKQRLKEEKASEEN